MALSDPFMRLGRVLAKRFPSPFFALEAWATRFAPSDWLMVGILGFVMFFSAGAMLATASLTLSTQVPARGGTYIEGVIGSPRFVNPLLAISETDRDLSKLVYSGLLKMDPDGTLSPDLASSYTVSEDRLTYTFTIRPDAIFQNATPVTANDVAFTIRQAQNPEIKSPMRAHWEGVAISIIDQATISFTLKSPYALPHLLWQEVNPEEFPFSTLNANPVGSGPFRVEGVKENASGIPVEYRLRAFTKGMRVPYIERFTFRFYPNADALKDALVKGEVQAANSISPENVTASIVTEEAVFGRVFGVFFNQNQNKIFTHKEVRAALDEAVDKKSIIDTVFAGYGSVINGPLPPESPSPRIQDARSKEERLANAQNILTKAGWKLGEDGVFIKKTKTATERLAFSLTTGNAPELKRSAELIAADWKRLGADVELRFFEESDLNVEVLRPRKYDALFFGLVVGEDVDLFAFWHSSQRNDPGLNIGLYANIDVDKKLENARKEPDIVKRRAIVEAAAATMRSETAAIFIYAPHFLYLTPRNVSGMRLGIITTPSDRFANVNEWYLAKERIWPIFMHKAEDR